MLALRVKTEAQELLDHIQLWEHWATIAQVAEREYGVSSDEFDCLLPEYQKFLVLCQLYGSVDMYSSSIDKLWHSHILYSHLYVDCCERYFGRYIHHIPNLADHSSECTGPDDVCAGKPCKTGPPTPVPQPFSQIYEAAFSASPPAVWNLLQPDGIAV